MTFAPFRACDPKRTPKDRYDNSTSDLRFCGDPRGYESLTFGLPDNRR
jgi:hypothetical protein